MYEHSASVTSVVLKRHLRHQHVGYSIPQAQDVRALIQQAALRPTRQRLEIAALLFKDDHRHVTAGDLGREADAAGIRVSLATVYNTLNQFAEAGLLRRVTVNGDLSYFDTHTGDHQHFYVEGEDRLIDVPEGSIEFGRLPDPPDGYVISRVDVVIRLRRIGEVSRNVCAKEAGINCCTAGATPPRFPR